MDSVLVEEVVMAQSEVYSSIVQGVRRGDLSEPFGTAEFRRECPGFAENTYRKFLGKHREGNGNESELFQRVSRGRYVLLRPFRYEL